MPQTTNILVLGRNGQVATELRKTFWPAGIKVGSLGRDQLDLATADTPTIAQILENANTAVVINAAAYTAVDQAETEHDLAFALNAEAPKRIAEACAQRGTPLIHLSTDYVFDGQKAGPYVETDETNPLGVYGASKLAGERAVQAILERHIIMRTAWVYSPYGNNFVKTMLRLGAERDELKVVNDQTGSPTTAASIAGALIKMTVHVLNGGQRWGIYHYTNEGHTTWYDFAREIFDQAGERGGPPAPRILPISTADYPTAAKRPQNSVLDCARAKAAFELNPLPWQTALDYCLRELLV